jgi:hypothetical protein
MDSNGRHTSASSITTNGQPSILNKNQKNENQQQNGTNEIIGRHRPSGASVMNARDPMTKQKMSNICEPGPLKRAQGRDNIEDFEFHRALLLIYREVLTLEVLSYRQEIIR